MGLVLPRKAGAPESAQGETPCRRRCSDCRLPLSLRCCPRLSGRTSSTEKVNCGSLRLDRRNRTGGIAPRAGAGRGTLELNDTAFRGDVRSLAGSVRGDGNVTVSGTRYPFRVSSGQSADGNSTRLHLNIDPGARPWSADLDGGLSFEARAPHFEGTLVLAVPPGLKAKADVPITPWRISARVKADPAAARLEQVEASYGPEESALKFAGTGEIGFGASPLRQAALSARQLDADKFAAKDMKTTEPLRLLPGLRALMAGMPQVPLPMRIEFGAEQIMLGGRPVQNLAAELHADAKADLKADLKGHLKAGLTSWTIDRLDFRAPGATQVGFNAANARINPSSGFAGALSIESSDPDMLAAWLQG